MFSPDEHRIQKISAFYLAEIVLYAHRYSEKAIDWGMEIEHCLGQTEMGFAK